MKLFLKKSFEYSTVILLGIICVGLHYSNIQPINRGFFCFDYSLKYPHIEHETVPQYLCLIIWLFISTTIIVTTELSIRSPLETQLKYCLSGIFSCIISTDILKYSVGKLRPYFLTLCSPDYNEICIDESAYYTIGNSEEQHFDEFFQKYVNDDNHICSSNITSGSLKEARLSFISGHTSFSFYFVVFLIIYTLRNTQNISYLKNFISFIHLLVFIVACWISLTRVSDYKHHPLDVLLGAVLGSGVSFFFNSWIFPHSISVGDQPSHSQHENSTTSHGDVTENMSISSIN